MCPEISIVIVNWNTRKLLKNCLQSIASVKTSRDSEIIIVDNGSNDGSSEMCRKVFPKVRLIENGSNLGFGQANNQGILSSKAELVLLLNSDTIVLPNSIEKMIEPMHKDSSIGVLGCRLIRPDGSYQPSSMNYPNLKTVIVERLLLYKLSLKLPRTPVEPPYIESQIECDWVSGACMLIRKNALETAGLFDPNIWMYGEEMELCYRIKAAGWKVAFHPDATIIHLGGESWKEQAYSPTLLKMTGLLFFFKKHFSISTYFTVCFLTSVGAMLRLLIWPFSWLFQKNERPHILLEMRSNLLILVQNIRSLFMV